MRGMTKKQCQTVEKLAESLITGAIGPGKPYLSTGLQWEFPHANGATVTLHLIRDSFDSPGYRHSWLACRLEKPGDWLDERGYTKPQRELPWPSYLFTYPSGKANYSPRPKGDTAEWRRELALHLYQIAEDDSPEQKAFGAIEWEPEFTLA